MDPKSFLSTVIEVLKKHSPVDRLQGFPAARLGWLLRSRYGVDWTEYGYPKLSAVLSDLRDAGAVRVGPNEKQALTVWLTDGAPPSAESEVSVDVTRQARCAPSVSLPFRRLRAAVWYAFVSPISSTSEKRLIHRQSGSVWSDAREPSGDPQQWVEVDPIPEPEQREWGLELLEGAGLTDDQDLAALIQRHDWFRAFPEALGTRDPILASRWNRMRSTRVQAHVEGWCQRNSVPRDIVFEPQTFLRTPVIADPLSRTSEPTTRTAEAFNSNKEAELRRKLLEVIALMSLDELLTLSLPTRPVVQVLRPDLLS